MRKNYGYLSTHTGKQVDDLLDKIWSFENKNSTYVIASDRSDPSLLAEYVSGFRDANGDPISFPIQENDRIYGLLPNEKIDTFSNYIFAKDLYVGDTVYISKPSNAPTYWIIKKGQDELGREYFNVRTLAASGGSGAAQGVVDIRTNWSKPDEFIFDYIKEDGSIGSKTIIIDEVQHAKEAIKAQKAFGFNKIQDSIYVSKTSPVNGDKYLLWFKVLD